jgi:iron complex transport system permease protein
VTAIAPPSAGVLDRVRAFRRRVRSGWVVPVRVGPVSARLDVRGAIITLVIAGIVAIGVAWSVSVGDFPLPLRDVIGELTGLGGNPDSEFIIRVLRLPRVLTAVLVGAAFGASGQIFQRLVHNPLASPDIIGVSSGAAAAAVYAIVIWNAPTPTVTGIALGGSVAAVVLIYLLAVKQGVSSYRLILIGIGLTAMLDAVVAYLLTKARLFDAQRAAVWLTGNLNGRGWEYVRPLTIALAVLVPVALIASRQLRVLELGDDCASGLGVGLRRSKFTLAMSGAGLAAVATAAAGPVGFVALVAPQIARRLVGARSLGIVPAAVVGAAIMTYADLIARRAFQPIELPVGVITAIVGAPYLLWLLARANKIGTGG